MKEYKKIIILCVVLLILVISIVVVFTTDLSIGNFKSAAIFTISDGKTELNSLIEREATTKAEHQSVLDALERAKNDYDSEKRTFEGIDQATVDLVKEATKDEKYFIEYLWITLGNYASDNNLLIDVITPGSTSASTGEVLNGDANQENQGSSLDTSIASDAIRIVVKGRYANVADFVYDVENDKELKFRLDNMKMVYKSNNQIEATFNVLSLQVKK